MKPSEFRREARITAGLAWPIVIGQVAQVAMGFTDTVMAGRLGPLDLGAIAVGMNLWILPFLFCLGLLMASASMIAHYFGAQRLGAIRDLVIQTALLVVFLAVAAFFTARGMADFLYLLGLDADITRVASDYVKAVSWGFPALVAYLALRFLSEGIGYTKPMMIIQVSGLLLNGLANYVLMFGKFGAPALGAVGAGWATALVMWSNLFLMLVYVGLHRRYHVIWKSRGERRDWSRLWELIRLGMPIATTLLAEIGMFATIALMMGKLGVVEVAAHQVAINFAAMAFMIPLGIATATTIRVGHALGEGQGDKVVFRGMVGIYAAGLCMIFTAAVMLLFPELIVSIYTRDQSVRDVAVGLLFMAAIFQLSDGIQIAATGALRGMKDTLYPLLITLVVYWSFGVPLSYYLGFNRDFGAQGLWMGLVASLTLAAVWLVLRFRRLSRELLLMAPEKTSRLF